MDGVVDGDARRNPVGDDAADALRQHADQLGAGGELLVGGIHRRSQLALQRPGDGEQLLVGGRLDEQARRAEDLAMELGTVDERAGVDRGQARLAGTDGAGGQ